MATRSLTLARLLRPYWNWLAIAFGAMLIQAAAELLEPWPLKIIFDYVLGSKPMPAWLSGWMPAGDTPLAVLNVAAVAVIVIAVIGAIGAYTEKYLSTAVWPNMLATICVACSITMCSACRWLSTRSGRQETWSFD